ncbi:hypothetical protein BGZ60DRAFT_519551 [Tricladium varicosporioides]|nr:hypothetical protein BGZ60DRAFT_519551 [Hymenoscyphus varicosporioides]
MSSTLLHLFSSINLQLSAMTNSNKYASVNEQMLASGRYSDLTIKCKGLIFKVHRAIVCLQSTRLAAAVDGNLKEGVTAEIDLSGNEPHIVENMLKFMYTSEYSDNRGGDSASTPTAPAPSKKGRKIKGLLGAQSTTPLVTMDSADNEATALEPLLTNALVYVIADKYNVQPLKELAKKKYEELIPDNWNKIDPLLKGIAVEAAGQHLKELVVRKEFASLCKQNGTIGFDVMKSALS